MLRSLHFLLLLTSAGLLVSPLVSAPAISARNTRNENSGKTPELPATLLKWHEDLDAALAAAKKLGRPLLVDFKAEWCGPCKKLERETFGDAKVVRLLRDQFVTAKVDVDAQQDQARKYGVTSLPTILILSSTGAELGRVIGFRPPEKFIPEITKASETSETFEKIKKEAVDQPGNVGAQRAYARVLSEAGNHAEASEILEAALKTKPGHAGLLLELGGLLMTAGKVKEATEIYEQLLRSEAPESAAERLAARLPLARCYLGADKAEKCAEAISGFLDGGGGSEDGSPERRFEALFLRGYAYARLKRVEKAIADLKTVQEEGPDSPWGLRAGYILDLIDAD